jgi:iron complex transport system permease protein
LALGGAWLVARPLDALALGEEGASHLGVGVERLKLGAIGLASLLTALAVSISGLVGFVGLVVPHAVRLLVGPGHRLLVPASALAGGAFLALVDLLARTLMAPAEIPVGLLTALLGAPFFLFLLRRRGRGYAL